MGTITATEDMDGMAKTQSEYKRTYYLRHKDKVLASNRAYRIKNLDKAKVRERRYYEKHAERIKKQASDYQIANREKCNLRKRLWANRNKQRTNAARLKWSIKNPDFKRKWIANKRRNDVGFRILCSLRHTLWRTRSTKKRSKSCEKMLGCSLEDFRIYLESKFEVGMTWGNYGKYGWHIDHIVPCALFDLTKEDHRKRCFHFSNLQPMFATENHKKAAKSDGQMRIL